MLAILFLMRGSCAAADTVITNIQELQDINLNPGGSYILANDINAAETADWNNGEGFDPRTGTGDVEIWIPVAD